MSDREPGGCQGPCLDSLAADYNRSDLEPLLLEAFRYHKWANLQLLDVCSNLSDEQLQLTSAGTYGPLAGTFLHLAAAEQRYVKRLGGSGTQPSGKPAVSVGRSL